MTTTKNLGYLIQFQSGNSKIYFIVKKIVITQTDEEWLLEKQLLEEIHYLIIRMYQCTFVILMW